jgi:hypothetical protein
MNSDARLFKFMGFLILLPLALAVFGGDRFRYPCQDPENWNTEACQKPQCEVTRSCPEHIFKGGSSPVAVATETKTLEKGCK